MEFLLAVIVTVGAFFFGASVGRDAGRKEVLADLRGRMAQSVQNQFGTLEKWGIKADTVLVDYFRESEHGIGYAEGPRGPYLVVNYDDLIQKLEPNSK